MTVKRHINHRAIHKVCHLHNSIFHSINLCHTFSILLYHLPCYLLKVTNCGMGEMKIFVYMAVSAYGGISKELDAHVGINNPC